MDSSSDLRQIKKNLATAYELLNQKIDRDEIDKKLLGGENGLKQKRKKAEIPVYTPTAKRDSDVSSEKMTDEINYNSDTHDKQK